MSTLAASATQAASAAGQQDGFLSWAILLALCALGLYVAIRLKVHRPASVLGPPGRKWGFAGMPLWPLWAALGAWFVGATVGASVSLSIAPKPPARVAPAAIPSSQTSPATVATGPVLNTSIPETQPATSPASATGPTATAPSTTAASSTAPAELATTVPAIEPAEPKGLTSEQAAVLSVLSPLISILVALVTLGLLQPSAFAGLGLIPRRALVGGIFAGLIGALIAIPWTFIVAIGTEQLYRALDYAHPPAHDLLRAMRELPPLLRWAAIAGAVVMAPVVEEFVFRGLIQTGLTEVGVLLSTFFGKSIVASEPAAASGHTIDFAEKAPRPLDYSRSAVPADAVDWTRLASSWLAIIVTAAAFALMHDRWTQPVIFFLGVGLGYVYQRTGQLWASITLHAMFNLISTVIYLAQ